ncbi:MAG: helix-hairpin-helix domain-containing protein [Rikenellaceae bacterium]
MARRYEFTKREFRGLISLLSIILVLVGYKMVYNQAIDTREFNAAIELLDELHGKDTPLFEFDPNTAELPELMRLGLTKAEAVSIIRYREYGKTYRIKEDLFTCYGISESLYYALEPYVVIADTFRLKRRDEYTSSRSSYSKSSYSFSRRERELLPISEFLADTVGAKYLFAIGALSRRQADAFVRWRDLSGIYNMNELRDCYVVSDSVAAALEPYIIFTPPASKSDGEAKNSLVDLNKADSAELRGVYGIGEKSVEAILNFRRALGGFYSVEQLSELKVVTESNFEKIIQQILCDSCDISKIDVNFASAKTIKGHPYITDKALRRLLKIRELKGGWSTIKEMTDDKIFSEEEATRVRPYLLFKEFESREVSGDEFL